MISQRSFSGRCFHGGIAPRPLLIFQNSSPSVSDATFAEVQSAGFGGGSAAAAGPSPLPLAPWHVTQYVSMFFFALPTPLTGFFTAFASAGACHSPCAHAAVMAAPPTSATAATTTPSDLRHALMTPPP